MTEYNGQSEQERRLAQLFEEVNSGNDTLEPRCISILKTSHSEPFHYEIVDTIGKGGMKQIYKAIDTLTRREVAMAVINKQIEDEKDLRYFVQEAWVTANLEHPNIVPVHDVGVNPDGNPYFTMKLLRGENLQAILSGLRRNDALYLAKYSQKRLLDIFMRVCEAVTFAHSRGVVHLDLKPENIQVCDFGEVQVMDWGISKLTQHFLFPEDQPHEGLLPLDGIEQTISGTIKGTPGYMSPEQIAASDSIDHKSDIYGLGAILYSILTYKKLPVSLLQAAPSEYSSELRDLIVNLPSALGSVALKALQHDPSRRYSTAQDIYAEVEAFQMGFATEAEQASLFRQILLLINRNRRVALVSGISFLILLFTTVLFIVRLQSSEQLARASEQLARRNEQEALEMLERWKKERIERTKQQQTSSKHYLKQAGLKFRNFDNDGCQKEIETALSLFPDSSPVISMQAFLWFAQQKYSRLIEFYDRTGHKQDETLVRLAKKFEIYVNPETGLLPNDQFIQLFKDIEGSNHRPNSAFIGQLFYAQNKGKSFNEQRSIVEYGFNVLNPGASMNYDQDKDRIIIKGKQVFSFAPVSGLKVEGIDFSGTTFSEGNMLGSFDELKYVNLEGTGVFHSQHANQFKEVRYINVANTPIRSFICRRPNSELDYISVAYTSIRAFVGNYKRIRKINVVGAEYLSLRSLLRVQNPPEEIILNESLLKKDSAFPEECKKRKVSLIVLPDGIDYEDHY